MLKRLSDLEHNDLLLMNNNNTHFIYVGESIINDKIEVLTYGVRVWMVGAQPWQLPCNELIMISTLGQFRDYKIKQVLL